MGNGPSIADVNDSNIDNNIIEYNLEGKVLKVIDVNKYIIAVKYNHKIRKILCKGKGYKLKDADERNIAIAKINSLINMSDSLVIIDAFGIDENGQLLVEIRSYNFSDSINTILLSKKYIENETNITLS